MSTPKTDVTIENGWQNESIQSEVIEFWKDLNILPAGIDPEERVNDLVFVARKEGQVIGVTTAHRRPAKLINNRPMFAFRIFVHPEHRYPGLFDKMSLETRDFLESLYREGKTDCIGLIAIIENKGLIEHHRKAVTPVTQLTFVGNTSDGKMVRVYYFPGVTV